MSTIINGIDTEAFRDTVDAVKADPGLAACQFRLRNEWVSAGLNRSTVTGFYGVREELKHKKEFVLYNDEPEVLLSGDEGPNPVENLLHALAGCMTSTIVYHAAAKGVKIDAIRTRFEGDLDLQGFMDLSDKVRKGYREIRVYFDIEGDMTLEQKREILAAGPMFSPVFDVVSNGTKVACALEEDKTSKAA